MQVSRQEIEESLKAVKTAAAVLWGRWTWNRDLYQGFEDALSVAYYAAVVDGVERYRSWPEKRWTDGFTSFAAKFAFGRLRQDARKRRANGQTRWRRRKEMPHGMAWDDGREEPRFGPEHLKAARRAVARLPWAAREVVRLKVSGHSYQEISRRLKVDAWKTWRKTLSDLRAKLSALVEE